MTLFQKTEARRFITLIDALYDNRVRQIFTLFCRFVYILCAVSWFALIWVDLHTNHITFIAVIWSCARLFVFTPVIDNALVCVSLRKSKIGFLNPNGFCFFIKQINPRSLGSWYMYVKGTEQSISRVDSSVPLMHHDPRDLGLICLVCKETQNPFSDSFGFKNPILDFLKETHP